MEMFREKAEEGTTAHFMKMCKLSPVNPDPDTQVQFLQLKGFAANSSFSGPHQFPFLKALFCTHNVVFIIFICREKTRLDSLLHAIALSDVHEPRGGGHST